ncbi:LysR family transcriptional regulator [Polynucleobacter sp. MWH-Braz-FAM2G]|uniref:LysR family transcriptional regulator n=1 Tax=Polynucleobacter sp. MWH-Braz-FAM2G TaxID=1855883 RepID=UPI001BFD2B8D|nr:LysR family transcriptional regulator [Polynucleobacter sp. MWH-Braz-FAM2G]QWD90226.1 LysR family transcriptional regulator [Polynucleobacter sp. MWH-Braz-FAM2G]
MNHNSINWDNIRVFLAVARLQSAFEAANHLKIDQSTISRRLKKLEEEIGSELFTRNSQGHLLNANGHRLLEYAETIENTISSMESKLGGDSQILTGSIRLGATEGFGGTFLAPHLANFCEMHAGLTVDLLALPRFINLSKREADLVVSIDRPETGPYITCKLTDYKLQAYATEQYLDNHPRIQNLEDLGKHKFTGYVDEYSFSPKLQYLKNLAPNAHVPFRSSSLTAQLQAALQGKMLAVLPCFLAKSYPALIPVLPDKTSFNRTFWLIAPSERKSVARVTVLWDYLRHISSINQEYLLGDSLNITLN